MKLIFNILLAILGFGAIILEFFVPSAGIIGIIGGGCVITGIVFTYINYGRLAGSIFLLSAAIIGPIILYLYFKLFPTSFIGKKLILHKTFNRDEGFNSGEINFLKVDDTGITESKLRPVGTANINGELVNVTTAGEFIDKNIKIKVNKIEGNKVIVTQED